MIGLWDTFHEQLVLMLVLMPILGAILSAAMWTFGRATVRTAAITNACFSLLLAGMILADQPLAESSDLEQFDTQPSVTWFRVASPTFSPPADSTDEHWRMLVTVGVGADGLGASLLLILAVGMLAVVASAKAGHAHDDRGMFPLLLLLHAALNTVLAAQDGLMFAVSLGVTGGLWYVLIGEFGRYDRRTAATRVGTIWFTASLLAGVAVVSAAILYDRVLTGASERTSRGLSFDWNLLVESLSVVRLAVSTDLTAFHFFWNQSASLSFLPWLLASGCLLTIIPATGWIKSAVAEAPRGVGGLLFASVQLVGSLIVLRYMLPAFPDQCDQWAPFLRGLASVGLLLAAWKATRATDRFELATQLGIASSQLAVLSFFTLQTAGIVGGLLVVLAHSSAAVLIEPLGCLTHVPASRRTHPTKFLASSIAEGTDTQSQLANRSGSGLAADSRPIDRLLGLLVVASLMGLPGLAGFTGLMLASTAIFLTSMTPLLIAWIAVIVLGSVLWQASGALRPNSAVESPPERFTLLPAAVMLVWLGVMPAILIARVTPVVERITSDPDDQTAILLEDRPNSVEIASKGGISAWP